MNNTSSLPGKIGILGGTFNPIHIGHLMLAKKAYETLSLDKVLIMPSGVSYMKKNVLCNEKRVEMARRAIKDYPYFELSLIEVERTGNTYTCDTLQLLKDENPDNDYYFILGADSLFNIEMWKSPEKIFSLCEIVCTVRDDYDIDAIKEQGNKLQKLGARIIYLDMPKIDISSSVIRQAVKDGTDYKEMLPESVVEYIQQERLYEED